MTLLSINKGPSQSRQLFDNSLYRHFLIYPNSLNRLRRRKETLRARTSRPQQYRAVGNFENPGVPVLFGHNLPPLVEIGLTDLPKSAMTPPASPGTTGLQQQQQSESSQPSLVKEETLVRKEPKYKSEYSVDDVKK